MLFHVIDCLYSSSVSVLLSGWLLVQEPLSPRLATGQSPAAHWPAQCLLLSLLYCSSYVSPLFSSLSLPYSIAPSLVCVAMNNNNNNNIADPLLCGST